MLADRWAKEQNASVTEDEVIAQLRGLPHVAMWTASADTGAPEIAWGDSFFYYEPDEAAATDRRFPFATLVTKDYPDFDTASDLDRPGVYRLNLSLGRRAFERLLGYPPAAVDEHRDAFDYRAADTVTPHPIYGKQGWVSLVVPGQQMAGTLAALLEQAYQRAVDRYRPPRTGSDG